MISYERLKMKNIPNKDLINLEHPPFCKMINVDIKSIVVNISTWNVDKRILMELRTLWDGKKYS